MSELNADTDRPLPASRAEISLVTVPWRLVSIASPRATRR